MDFLSSIHSLTPNREREPDAQFQTSNTEQPALSTAAGAGDLARGNAGVGARRLSVPISAGMCMQCNLIRVSLAGLSNVGPQPRSRSAKRGLSGRLWVLLPLHQWRAEAGEEEPRWAE